MVVPKKLWPLWMASAAAAAASPSVTVDAGTILGGQCGSGCSVFYKAIPYADPPVRGLRFEASKAYGKYPGGRLNATAPAPACIQFGDTFKALGKTSEDCLCLDIWTPADATEDSKLPVKVFVFGGSNIEGGIRDTLYDGCNTADDGAILVSINYRLGPLGFMALESAGIHGNQGIQDLLLGLKWVKNSISAFGGDSCDVRDKKCLQGKSTIDLRSVYFSDEYLKTGLGAADVTIPSVHSHKFWPYVDGTIIPEAPSAVGAKVPAIFGYNQREGMMDTLTKYNSTEAAASATPAAYTKFLKDNFGPAAAIIEKYYGLSLFQSTPLPVIAAISTVATDAEYKCPAYASAAQTVRNNVPAWVYEFTHNSTCVWLDTMPQAFIDDFGAAHTAELPYVSGNLHFDFADKNSSCTGTSDEWSLSKEMMGLWTAMAEKGNPSTNDIHWPEFRATTNGSDIQGMVFGNFSIPGVIDFSLRRRLVAQYSPQARELVGQRL
ncbi:Carboxylesterase, type B [Akanthomyces lecanii RCEF 1005]|uniref:Carboxylesterase, type B n=1 Tax=Akanthomyces lecanii RCEF 1005 TaxID=1081108 RepID=A0A167ZQN6_CORDF|nr:Carboxylesterase, type B [Akanthomyces lecanii RCEF 1005]